MLYNKLRLLICTISPVLLAGCTASLQELQQISPMANDFSGSLAAEYLAYSQAELEQGQDYSSEYFAAKGLGAAKGEVVMPDDVREEGSDSSGLLAARQALVGVLNDDVKHVAPQKAARAQMLFDCWNAQTASKRAGFAAGCAEEFGQVYDELQQISDNLTHGAIGRSTFDFYVGSAALDAEARYVIAKVAAHLKSVSDYAVELDAHHNVKDNKSSKGRLARARLTVVRDALIRAGVPKERVFFAKNRAASDTSKMVYLSSDKIVENRNKFDIIITSSRHFNAVSK